MINKAIEARQSNHVVDIMKQLKDWLFEEYDYQIAYYEEILDSFTYGPNAIFTLQMKHDFVIGAVDIIIVHLLKEQMSNVPFIEKTIGSISKYGSIKIKILRLIDFKHQFRKKFKNRHKLYRNTFTNTYNIKWSGLLIGIHKIDNYFEIGDFNEFIYSFEDDPYFDKIIDLLIKLAEDKWPKKKASK